MATGPTQGDRLTELEEKFETLLLHQVQLEESLYPVEDQNGKMIGLPGWALELAEMVVYALDLQRVQSAYAYARELEDRFGLNNYEEEADE